MAFRIHFTRDDLLRVSLGEGPDPLHEAVISLRVLQRRRPGAVFGPWQRWVRQQIPHSAHVLGSLVPSRGGCPDFLTPMITTDVDADLDALLHTPRSTLRSDLEELADFTSKPLPTWASSLADGSPRALETVGHALRDWHRTAIAPLQRHLHAQAEAARLSAVRALLTEGLDAMLSRLHPTIRWTPPVLELARPDLDADLHLEGRGLRLIPSLFCGHTPVVTPSPEPPVLAFPVSHDTIWTPASDAAPEPRRTGLTALLGHSRATVLHAIALGHGITTTDLAHRTGISPATVSHHTAVLRNAGLITTHRTGTNAHHFPTPLGTQLVNGEQARLTR
ncbi:helix-turn-helix transcriptional regulator [Streptomyces ferrugineus]|uniref:Helix-turn-helix transcriptional regulator n=1 Tax=Streptomyces ferrugineus TaxID=1413221 RepID=A0A7M2SWN0_9ACTN|nr:helix-turn-helix domain-containing protein [Streptomyces ferrugineus]QOV40777.1 helix-turn-helix transcriptional regulator [Streptomyces ferrugineus]